MSFYDSEIFKMYFERKGDNLVMNTSFFNWFFYIFYFCLLMLNLVKIM